MSLRRILLSGAVVVSAVVSVVILYTYGTCRFETDTPTHQYRCYERHTDGIAKRWGVARALAYVHYVVYPHTGFGVTHTLLHAVGETAFDENPSLPSLDEYFIPYEDQLDDSRFLGTFDGLVHGYVTDYVLSATETPMVAAQRICAEAAPRSIIARTGCAHTMGHAFMHANNNNIKDSLALCDGLVGEGANEQCYQGVFMENEFLYSRNYHPESHRPEAHGTSMKDVCEQFTGMQFQVCSTYVGESFLIAQSGTVTEAFNECSRLTDNQDACAGRLGSSVLASWSHTRDEAIALCKKFSGETYFDACVGGAVASVRMGYTAATGETLQSVTRNFFTTLYLAVLAVSSSH